MCHPSGSATCMGWAEGRSGTVRHLAADPADGPRLGSRGREWGQKAERAGNLPCWPESQVWLCSENGFAVLWLNILSVSIPTAKMSKKVKFKWNVE